MSTTRDEKRIRVALDYIDANIKGSLSLAHLADQVHLSEFHFHRLFKQATNQTLNQYVRRKRLTKAMYCLHYYKQLTVAQVASNCGFSSAANFTKAFTQYYGCSPSQFRKGGQIDPNCKMYQESGKQIAPRGIYNHEDLNASVLEQFDVQYSMIQRDEQKFIYVASPSGYNINGIRSAWQTLGQQVHQAGLNGKTVEGEKVGLGFDNHYLTATEQCRYEAAIRVNSFAGLENFSQRTIAAGTFLRAHIKGPTTLLDKFYCWFMGVEVERRKLTPSRNLVLENYLLVDDDNNFIDVMTELPVV